MCCYVRVWVCAFLSQLYKKWFSTEMFIHCESAECWAYLTFLVLNTYEMSEMRYISMVRKRKAPMSCVEPCGCRHRLFRVKICFDWKYKIKIIPANPYPHYLFMRCECKRNDSSGAQRLNPIPKYEKHELDQMNTAAFKRRRRRRSKKNETERYER